MKKAVAKFRFVDFRVTKSIYTLDAARYDKIARLDVSFKFPSDLEQSDGGRIYFPMDVLIEDSGKVIRIQVSVVGLFESDVDLTKEKSFIEVNAPAILFPYVRAYISSMTSLSGISPIILPTYNMTRGRRTEQEKGHV